MEASLNIYQHPDDENMEAGSSASATDPHLDQNGGTPTPSTSSLFPNFTVDPVRSLSTRVKTMEIGPQSGDSRDEITERECPRRSGRWVKRYDGKRVSMDPESDSSIPFSSLYHGISSDENVEPISATTAACVFRNFTDNTGPSSSNNSTRVKNMMDPHSGDGGTLHPYREYMETIYTTDSNAETGWTEYLYLFSRIGQFIGLVTPDKKPIKKRKMVTFGIDMDKMFEIKCFVCGRSWEEITSAGSYVRITRCGHFLCHADVQNLARTGEKCPQCKRIKVFKVDCKICVLEQ